MKRRFWLPVVASFITLISGCGMTSSSTEVFDYNIEDVGNASSSVWYEIFVQSFYDSNGNGIGDLNGVTMKLDYLQDLGIGGIWFMPIHPASSYHGYDVTNYYGIAPRYGSLEDFQNYLTEAKTRNIKTILDLVVNHTSNSHPWFIEGLLDYSIENCGDPASKCNYYNFSDTRQEGYESYGSGVYAEARFWSGMPDLNLDNPFVKEEIRNIMAYWFALGIDGFRLDAVTSYFTGNVAKNKTFLTWLGQTAKELNPDCFIVGEGPWSMSSSGMLEYYGGEIDSYFNFPVSVTGNKIIDKVRLSGGYDLARYNANYNANLYNLRPDAIDTPFLSNHDQARVGGVLFVENNDLSHKVLASIYLLMPGRPFVYYGEELRMRGSGRDENKRLPFIWSESDKTGETLPAPSADYNMTLQITQGASDLWAIPDSQLNHYRKVISIRNKYNALIEKARITALMLDAGEALYALRYEQGDDAIIIVTNITGNSIAFTMESTPTVLDGIYPTLAEVAVSENQLTLPAFSTVVLDA